MNAAEDHSDADAPDDLFVVRIGAGGQRVRRMVRQMLAFEVVDALVLLDHQAAQLEGEALAEVVAKRDLLLTLIRLRMPQWTADLPLEEALHRYWPGGLGPRRWEGKQAPDP